LCLVSAVDNWPPASNSKTPTRHPIEFKDLKNLPLVLPSHRDGLREFIERLARTNSIQLDVVVEMDALRQIIALVSSASAYSILSPFAIVNEVANGELVRIPIINPVLNRTAYVIRKRNRPITRASLSVEKMFSVILKEIFERHHLSATLADTVTDIANP
jgi:LysR family nitrogen assimilation transcriptional regulator